MSTKMIFKAHKPLDKTDPGFTIPGRKLRWISALGNEGNFARPWETVTKEDLKLNAPDILAGIEKRMPGIFSKGNTIRRGDLVLAMAPQEVVDDLKTELKERSARMESMIRARPKDMQGLGSQQVSVEVEHETVTLTADDFKKGSL